MPANEPERDTDTGKGGLAPPVRWHPTACFRRALLAALVLGQTTAAVVALTWVMPFEGGYLPATVLIGLFALLHGWIAVGCWTAVFGFLIRRKGGDQYSLASRHTEESLGSTALAPTAIVIPICNEPVNRTLSGVRAVYRELKRQGQLQHFDFYILSDTRNPEVWLAEQAAWQALCRELDAGDRLFYRRRTVKLNYKSGNIADFLRRWGRWYRYMVVLDADSLLGGETLLKLVRLMEREPDVGIIQTSPMVIRARTLFARLQQFASRVYSPLFATGLAAVQMGDAAYWGHNAIIRVDAFMQHCGLRKLRGPGLFGGPITSHDFVEAAFMGRAGYEVWLEPSLQHSYEESPPTLEDELIRDHRWARGNLQHLWILLTTSRLRFAHRMAFVNGIMSYLASPLWLLFVILTMVMASRVVPSETTAPLTVLGDDLPWAIGLGLSTLALLFLPRVLGVVDILATGQAPMFGGSPRLLASTLLEAITSLLLAPVKMLAHTRSVLCALINVPVRWAGQSRYRESGWAQALKEHRISIVLALCWSAAASWAGPASLILWSLPVTVPLLFAAPTSVVLGSRSWRLALANLGLLATPESRKPDRMIREADSGAPLLPDTLGLSNVQQAVLSPTMNALHRQLARVRPRQRTAAILQQCIEHGPDQLAHWQLNLLCRDRQALASLHNSAWRSGRQSYWGRRIASLALPTGPSLGEQFETTDRYRAPAQRPVRGAAATTLPLDTVDCG